MREDAASVFEAALDAHGPLVLRVCRAILVDSHAGDDAAQEAFLRLWVALQRGDGPYAPGPWLRRAAASAAIDALRKRAPAGRGLDRDRDAGDREPPEPIASSPAPSEGASSAELAVGLRRALASLSPLQRTAFVLRHDARLSFPEIAALLGATPSTVKTHFARASLRLRAALSSFLTGGPRS